MKNKTASAGMPAYIRLLLAGGALGAFAIATPAYAAGTGAGTQIKNKATATWDQEEDPVESNEVTITVDEVLDVDVEWEDTSNISVNSPDEAKVLKFSVTNVGNGDEKFDLDFDLPTGDFEATGVAIYLDTDASGSYEEGTDALYSSAVPTIAADGDVTVFVVGDIPASLTEGDLGNVRLTATSQTGSGTAGTTFAGQGEGGGAAVVGTTGATDNDTGIYQVGTVTPPPTPIAVDLDKEQAVEDVYGGELAIPGSTITYTLVATVTGDGTANNLVISDDIPTGTTYEPESVTLKVGAAAAEDLTDAADSDEGTGGSSGIEVDLGDAPAGVYTITFQVKIDE